jgi:metal-sulfur cluster biosynthetic enzyme
MVKKEELMAALNEVVDPELGMGLVDLGLIYEIVISPRKKGHAQEVKIKMTFTTPACPVMDEMIESVKSKLEAFPDTDIDLSIVFDPPWSIDRLSKKARIKLGLV